MQKIAVWKQKLGTLELWGIKFLFFSGDKVVSQIYFNKKIFLKS